jgi:crossover junction endodeoxyribonuclease RuvC
MIIGIDPGYDRMGWAVASPSETGWSRVKLGCIKTNPQESILKRYQQLDQELELIIRENQPTEAAVETIFFSKNTKTAIKVAEARGVILATLIRHHIKVFEYNPMSIKETVTGNGQADKLAVEKMIRLEFKISNQPYLDDALDALAAVLTHKVYQQNGRMLA